MLFADENTFKDYLLVHVILGVTDYQKIKTKEPIIVRKHPESHLFTEFIKLGCTLAGKQGASGTFAELQFFVWSGKDKFKEMCSLDASGIKDERSNATKFCQHFNDQIMLTKDGFYETPFLKRSVTWRNIIKSWKSNRMLELLNLYLNPLWRRWCSIFPINLLSRNQHNHPCFESCMTFSTSQQTCMITERLLRGWTTYSTAAVWHYVSEEDPTSLYHGWY